MGRTERRRSGEWLRSDIYIIEAAHIFQCRLDFYNLVYLQNYFQVADQRYLSSKTIISRPISASVGKNKSSLLNGCYVSNKQKAFALVSGFHKDREVLPESAL